MISSDLRDVEEHCFQVACDGDLFHGISKFAVLDPQAAGAARKVAGHQVHSEAEKLGDEQTFLDVADDLMQALRAGLEKEVARTDAGRSRQSARGVAGGLQSKLSRGVGIQQVRLEHAILNHDSLAAGYTFGVERAGTEAAAHGAIVDHVDLVARNLLVQLAGEE